MSRPRIRPISPKNIIVRMPNWLGDLVMATPILADLRNHWPEAKITVFCQGSLGTVLQEDPNINEVLSFQKPKHWWKLKETKKTATVLQQKQYDLGVILTNSLSSAYLFWKGDVSCRIGFKANGRGLLLNQPIPFPAERSSQHLVKTYKTLLEPLGIEQSRSAPKLYTTQGEQQAAKEMLKRLDIQSSDYVIGINPGAAFGSAKCWLPERFMQLTEKLLEFPFVKIVYFGDKNGALLVNDICNTFSNRVVNIAGKTSLRELIAGIQQCNLFLTNDSGPMHVASALGVPLIALFGSTSNVATGPYGGGKVIHKHVACSPCYRRECPIDFRCMKQIEVDEVYDSIYHFISKHDKHTV
jgi:heptosyltransferase II